MDIHDLLPAEGSKKKRKRVGRGPGSGHGKTCCRGHNGQRSRAGSVTRPGFEGGQMPIHRRLPKRGFNNIFKRQYNIINICDLKTFKSNSGVDTDALRKAGLVKRKENPVKLLGKGEISQSIVIKVHQASKSARKKVESAGGKVEII